MKQILIARLNQLDKDIREHTELLESTERLAANSEIYVKTLSSIYQSIKELKIKRSLYNLMGT